MSRLKRFKFSLLGGYIELGSNVMYVIVSVPLAIHYLGKERFGIWALVSQIMTLIHLADAGISGSTSRIFIEYKDNKGTGSEYEKTMGTVCWFMLAISLAFVMIIIVFKPLIMGMLRIPSGLENDFYSILLAYTLIFSVGYAFTYLQNAIFAHQRLDFPSWVKSFCFLLSIPILWVCYEAGLDLWSLIVVHCFMTLITVLSSYIFCKTNGYLSPRIWSAGLSYQKMIEVVHFSKGRLLTAGANATLRSIPTLLISRYMGLNDVATWTIGIKLGMLIQQFVHKIINFSYPFFGEMHVRGEKARLANRMKDLCFAVSTLMAIAGGGLLFFNTSFIKFWTGSEVIWPWQWNIPLILWLYVETIGRYHWTTTGLQKTYGLSAFAYPLNSALLLLLGITVFRSFPEIFVLFFVLLVSEILTTFTHNIGKTSRIFEISFLEVFPGWSAWSLLGLLIYLSCGIISHIHTVAIPQLIATYILVTFIYILCAFNFRIKPSIFQSKPPHSVLKDPSP